jgi:tetratricopeptide (TPR) repeat protein
MDRNKSLLVIANLLIILLSPAISSATYIHQLLEMPITNALNSRDSYYKKVGIPRNRTTFNLLRTQKGNLALKNQLELNIDLFSPWYRFLLGIVNLHLSDEETASLNFEEALKCAQNNLGLTWVLFFEFYDAGLKKWPEECLKQLEKDFLSMGAQSAPVLSQQLMTIAKSEGMNGNNQIIEKYNKWSSSFEQYPFWQTFYQGWRNLTRQPEQFIKSYTKCTNMIRKSWLLQLKFLYYLYKWLRYAILFYIGIILFTISLKTMPIALHQFTCLFPHSVGPRIRYIFVIAIFLSLASFGIIPFLLLTAIFLWPYLEEKKKQLIGFVICLLILSPVDARIQEIFRVTFSKNQPLSLLQRSISENYNADLENQVMEYIEQNDFDYLGRISAAILNLKNGNPDTALIHIKHYEELIGNDPVALLTAGNIYYANGDLEKSKKYYKKCLNAFPQNEYALFNLGQINLSLMNTSEGTEQISKAAEINHEMINTFLEKNAMYFPDSVPPLRHFIQPEYKPGYFWRHLFLKNCGSWKSTNKLWGASFFGIPPLLFLIISPIIILLLLIKFNTINRKILFCKLCQSTMCVKCRIGLLCINCAQKIGTIHNEKLNKNKRLKIHVRTLVTEKYVHIILNILSPGAGNLYNDKASRFTSIILIMLTSFIYASYTSLLIFNFSYPFWIVKNFFILLFCFLLLYNIICTILYLRALFFELKPAVMEEASYVT